MSLLQQLRVLSVKAGITVRTYKYSTAGTLKCLYLQKHPNIVCVSPYRDIWGHSLGVYMCVLIDVMSFYSQGSAN